jgi:pSer/pThr/pTyr-binding forkhead associated (FHA) protein
MGGSTADTPTTPESLRASDAERDHAVSELRNEFAEGRLSHETFMYRMQSALDARHRGQLAGLFTDLPPRRPGAGKLMARIRAMLQRADPEARKGRPDGAEGIPRAQQTAGPSYGQAPPRIPPAPHAWGSQPAPPPVNPVPLAFPPGSGVRFTIGRTRDCDLCLTDLSVSRMHALLVRRQDGWVLSDLGSHNGTRLNGWLVREPVQLRPGDRVEFGSMAFIIAGDPPPVPLAVGEEEEEGPALADAGPEG